LADPFEGRAAERLSFILLPLTAEEFQVNRFLGIRVNERFDQFTDRYLDTKFLAQFTREAFFECFIRLALAAREFPQTSQMSIGVALSNQQFAIAEDQASSDIDRFQKANYVN